MAHSRMRDRRQGINLERVKGEWERELAQWTFLHGDRYESHYVQQMMMGGVLRDSLYLL